MKTAIVYYSQHHGNTKKLLDAIKDKYDVFLITTSGANPSDGFYKAVTDAVEKKNCKVIGRYGCFGYDTFGPFKLVRGLKK